MHKIIVSAAPGLAFIVGLFTIKQLTPFYKIILLQVMIYLVVLYLSYTVSLQHIHLVYNIYLPVEIALLLRSVAIYFKKRSERVILLVCFVLFLLVYFIQIGGKLTSFANFASVAEGLIMLVIYLTILKIQFSIPTFTAGTSSLFWLCMGSAIYFGGTIPLLSIFNFANKNFLSEHGTLFNSIVDVLANIRYLSVALSFWLCYRTHNRSLKGIA